MSETELPGMEIIAVTPVNLAAIGLLGLCLLPLVRRKPT
jgi:MYXO-CTERM domain-containing protein